MRLVACASLGCPSHYGDEDAIPAQGREAGELQGSGSEMEPSAPPREPAAQAQPKSFQDPRHPHPQSHTQLARGKPGVPAARSPHAQECSTDPHNPTNESKKT